MAVIVRSDRDEEIIYEDGADWFIDEEGRLHIRDSTKKHIAAYNRSAWGSAGMHPEARPKGFVSIEQVNADIERDGIVIDTDQFRPVDEMDIEASKHAAQRWAEE